MPKNIFFMSFLYVFIACTLFIAATVHSASIGEDLTPVGPVGKVLESDSRFDDTDRLFFGAWQKNAAIAGDKKKVAARQRAGWELSEKDYVAKRA